MGFQVGQVKYLQLKLGRSSEAYISTELVRSTINCTLQPPWSWSLQPRVREDYQPCTQGALWAQCQDTSSPRPTCRGYKIKSCEVRTLLKDLELKKESSTMPSFFALVCRVKHRHWYMCMKQSKIR